MMKRRFSVVLCLLLGACSSSGPGVALRVLEVPPGGECPYENVIVESGVDDNENGILDDEEVMSSESYCPGDPLPAPDEASGVVTREDPELPGAICEFGGVAIHVGLDNDDDGLLSDDEIIDTAYICSAGVETTSISFSWDGSACPDLTVAGRTAAVIISGVDQFGIAADEELIMDCDDGDSGGIAFDGGVWDFDIDVVDQYSDSTALDPFDCFALSIGDECLYYTEAPSEAAAVNTLFGLQPALDISFDYGFGDFTVDYTMDGLAPDSTQCAGFGPDGADELRIAMSFYNGAGRVDDFFVCGSTPVTTRDLPLGIYQPFFDLLDSDGSPVNDEPAVPNTANGEVSLSGHLENLLIQVDIAEF